MINKTLSQRLERLETEITPAYTEEQVLVIIAVDGDGNRVDSGIRLKVPGVPKPVKKRRW
jgi:hypothetical protein